MVFFRFQWAVSALGLSGLAALMLTGCDKIDSKLQRLAEAGGIAETVPVAPAEPALTEEEKALQMAAQDPSVFDPSVEADVPKAEPFELNKSSVVSILGYHDFRDRGGSPMLISAPKFREQMEAIRESGIPVISMSQLLAWKRGEKNIPEESIVITMDDGWEGVYEYAFPILKEMGFPFTVYLYKKYVNIGGRSMDWRQIKEMMQHGCEVGSHSVSHDSLRPKRGKTADAAFQEWVVGELKESKTFLEENLGIECTGFAYPYGVYDDSTMETVLQVGYEAAVTVNGQKVNWDTPIGELGRYIVHGESDTNFKLATSFRGRGDVTSSKFVGTDATNEEGKPLIVLTPSPDQVVTERRPMIQANLSGLGDVDPESVRLSIGGIGVVPAVYDPDGHELFYQMPYRIRTEDCLLTLKFRRAGAESDEVVNWRFKVDLKSDYLPKKTAAIDP